MTYEEKYKSLINSIKFVEHLYRKSKIDGDKLVADVLQLLLLLNVESEEKL